MHFPLVFEGFRFSDSLCSEEQGPVREILSPHTSPHWISLRKRHRVSNLTSNRTNSLLFQCFRNHMLFSLGFCII